MLLKINASSHEYDFSQAFTPNRIIGLWRMMSGFQLAVCCRHRQPCSLCPAKTATFLLLRYFIDEVLGQGNYSFRW